MEPLTMFAATVGLISGIHLLSSALDPKGKEKYNHGNRQAKREDWYCFFQPSDLLGTTGDTVTQQPTQTKDDSLEQRRRQQAKRPRIQA